MPSPSTITIDKAMYKGKKTGVIIAAAGSGLRMGGGISKQFIKIGGIPVLVRSIQAFSRHEAIDCIYVITGESQENQCRELLAEWGLLPAISGVVIGGRERQDSVYAGLCALEPDMDLVLIHDGARPYVSERVIDNVLSEAERMGAAIAAVPAKDTIRQLVREAEKTVTLDRSSLYLVQTPQGFERKLILRAYENAFTEGLRGTDDAALVEMLGYPVNITEGSYSNIKITTKEDLPMEVRVGTGFDVHCFAEERRLILGGVDVPFEKGLLGHSDADVLVHAIMDALLGAAGLPDIGTHFPDTDEQYLGVSSLLLLERVGELLQGQGYTISNIDAAVIAQRPKLAPYINQMREKIAETLCIEECRVNIKATTTEKLGFVGREEGIAAQAVCLLNTN